MRHEREIEINQPWLNDAYVVPYPGWLVTLVWLSAILFGGLFWWGVISLIAR